MSISKENTRIILVLGTIFYLLALLPASYFTLSSPIVMRASFSDIKPVEWVNFLCIISFPAVVLVAIFSGWGSYNTDRLKGALVWMSIPLTTLLLFFVTL
jgi:hypothetical protein